MSEENKPGQEESPQKDSLNFEEKNPARSELSEKEKKRISAAQQEALASVVSGRLRNMNALDATVHMSLTFPMNDEEEMDELGQSAKNLSLADNEESLHWQGALTGAISMYPQRKSLSETAKNPDAMWRQKLSVDGGDSVGPGRPRISGGSGSQLSGEAAVLKMNSVLSGGGVIQVPCWHSGFWVSMKAPNDSAIYGYEHAVLQEKVAVGRATKGLAYSNTSVLRKKHLLNLIYDHIYDSTVKGLTREMFLEHLNVLDIPMLVWGLASTMYPRGYPLSQPCTSNIGECSHVEEVQLNLGRIAYVDDNAFSDSARKHMANRHTKHDIKTIEAYRESVSSSFLMGDTIRFDLRIPTAEEYLNIGERWINDTKAIVEQTYRERAGGARDDYFVAQTKATSIRQYSHWIERIVFVEGDSDEDHQYVTDRDTIDSMCAQLSGDDTQVELVKTEVNKFIDAHTHAFIGLPTYTCPACSGAMETGASKHLIPVDVERLFFILTKHRLTATNIRAEV